MHAAAKSAATHAAAEAAAMHSATETSAAVAASEAATATMPAAAASATATSGESWRRQHACHADGSCHQARQKLVCHRKSLLR
jgi:hypothetical protein